MYSNQPLNSLKVAIRIRPLDNIDTSYIRTIENTKLQITYKANTQIFNYDYVFDEECDQNYIFRACVYELLDDLFNGYNSTILAYGQTSSGKTYTMGAGLKKDNLTDRDFPKLGICPRVFQEIFLKIGNSQNYRVSFSCVEIHNEKLIDLLNTKPVDKRIPERYISVKNTQIYEIQDFNEALSLLVFVNKNRSVMHTNMNPNSSRSHCIYTIYLKDTFTNSVRFFKLFDLAGSEKPDGNSKKSGVSVNLGLCGLNRLLLKLAEGETVVYRGCELNKNLKGSFDENCRTLFIACLNPLMANHRETLSTLNYAKAATSIKLKNNNRFERANNTNKKLSKKKFEETASSPFMFSSDGYILFDDNYKCLPTRLSDTAAYDSIYYESSDLSNYSSKRNIKFENFTNNLSRNSRNNHENDTNEITVISRNAHENDKNDLSIISRNENENDTNEQSVISRNEHENDINDPSNISRNDDENDTNEQYVISRNSHENDTNNLSIISRNENDINDRSNISGIDHKNDTNDLSNILKNDHKNDTNDLSKVSTNHYNDTNDLTNISKNNNENDTNNLSKISSIDNEYDIIDLSNISKIDNQNDINDPSVITRNEHENDTKSPSNNSKNNNEYDTNDQLVISRNEHEKDTNDLSSLKKDNENDNNDPSNISRNEYDYDEESEILAGSVGST